MNRYLQDGRHCHVTPCRCHERYIQLATQFLSTCSSFSIFCEGSAAFYVHHICSRRMTYTDNDKGCGLWVSSRPANEPILLLLFVASRTCFLFGRQHEYLRAHFLPLQPVLSLFLSCFTLFCLLPRRAFLSSQVFALSTTSSSSPPLILILSQDSQVLLQSIDAYLTHG